MGKSVPADAQNVGAFTGFQASIHKRVVQSKAYYFLTFPKPPNKSVVHEVMCRMVAAAEKNAMPFIQLVGDQPVYTLIVQLKNENPERFGLILPFLGPFHTQMSFISTINKRFKRSGIADLLVAADIIVEGSVHQALSGKHYKRSLRCLKIMYEVLIRRIVQHGLDNGLHLSAEVQDSLDILRHSSSHSKDILKRAHDDLESSPELSTFVDKAFEIYSAAQSSMATYWLSLMNMVEILFMNIHALRVQDWDAFKESIRMMLPWLQVYDNSKYGKWLLEFWLEITTMPDEKEAYMRDGLFSQSLTGKPYSNLPLDMWIEMTMNKGSKMKAGWTQFLKNEPMLLIHTRTINSINRVRVSLHALANLKNSSRCHSELSSTRLKIDEQAVQDMDSCVTEFACDPFDITNPTLRSLQSGFVASDQLVQDFETAHDDGENLVQKFFQERMFSTAIPFDAVVHRNKRCSFSNPPDTKCDKVKAVKTDAMESKAVSQVIALSESSTEKLDLVHVVEHRVTDECLSIFNFNGTMTKCQKSKLAEKLNFTELPEVDQYIALIDMGFIWRFATPTAEDREKTDGTLFTWRDYAQKMFSLVCARHSNASVIVFVNDPYDILTDIKDSEHELRNAGPSYVNNAPNIFMKADDKLPSQHEFSNMFKNPQNKTRLQLFLLTEFRMLAIQMPDVKFIYSLRNVCWDLSSGDKDTRIADYECLHTEADTILFYIYYQIRKSGLTDTVVLDAQDTDVVVLAAYVAHKVDGMLAIKRKHAIYDCKLLCTDDEYESIVPLHIFTGSDAATAFFGHGKKTVYEAAMKSEVARKQLKTLGTSIPMTQRTVDSMRQFTIKYVYRDNNSETLAEARSFKWKNMKNKSTLRIPPDLDSLILKIQRANYQVYILHNCNVRDEPPSPLNNGWHLVDGKCKPIRYTKPALPECLNKLVNNICVPDIATDDTDIDDSASDSDGDDDSTFVDAYEY